jgi:integrase
MAVQARTVQNKRDANGALTGKPGTVYDVNIKYNSPEGKKSYAKRGFLTKKEAVQHEAEMRTKLSNPSYSPAQGAQGRTLVKDYMPDWLEKYGKVNLRPSTFESYKSIINIHINPHIGHIPIREVTPAMLDDIFKKMYDKGLSQTTVRNVHRVLSVSLEGARKYRYIEHNPARDTLTKFGQQGKTPDPYTVQQMQQLMGHVSGTEWEMPVMLGGMYGLRLSEILGLRWRNVDMEKGVFSVVEQLPFRLPAGTTIVEQMAAVKGKGADNAGERALPITETTRPYFERHIALQIRQREHTINGGGIYYENDIVVARANGAPHRRDQVSANFGQMLRRSDFPYIRFHDLRHTAATNMHQLTGDFFTVGMILGHSLKGAGIQLGISTKLDSVTAQYVDVRIERKKEVLNAYHSALHPQKEKAEESKPPKKKSHGIEL